MVQARLDAIRPEHLRPGPNGPEIHGHASDTLRAFAIIEAVENGTTKQRKDYQRERIAWLLDHAHAHSPFWAERIPAGRSALWRLPVLSKAELRAQVAAEGALPVPPEHGAVGTAHTSGSTAEPLKLHVTMLNGHYNQARFAFDDIASGRDLTLPLTIMRSAFTAATRFDHWPTMTGEIWHTGPGRGLPLPSLGNGLTVEEALALALAEPLGHFSTMPSMLWALLDAVENGAPRPAVLGEVLPFGETVWPELRERTRRVLGVRIVDRYTCEEVGPIAMQCPEHDTHYHVASSNVLLEAVDDRGREVAEGRAGNLLVTGLNSAATPLLRYGIGDVARVLPRCACGFRGQALAGLQGRRRSLLRLPDGSRRFWHMGNAGSAAWLAIAPVREVRILQTGIRELVAEVAASRVLTAEDCTRLGVQLRSETSDVFSVQVRQVDRVDWGRSGKRHVVVNLLDDIGGQRPNETGRPAAPC